MITLELFGIIAFCMAGCGIHAWFAGKTAGIDIAVQYMIDEGVLEVSDE